MHPNLQRTFRENDLSSRLCIVLLGAAGSMFEEEISF